MTTALRRRAFYRTVFFAAGLYNIAWGAFAALDPNWFFRFCGMAPLNHPEIYACVGMVVGLYGVGYLEVARAPERGFALAAIGLTGKILGPVGMIMQVATGAWPPAAALLCVTNDLIWWLPFVLYLREAYPRYRAEWSLA
jgi:hypothetical protein